jgi:uncharacterized membrane protein
MPSGTAFVQPRNNTKGTGSGGPDLRDASLGLAAIVVLGTILRLVALGRKSFWLDEIASVWTARLPAPVFGSLLWHSEGNMAFYYTLLRPWLHFGTGEASVRLLSALMGVASIPLMYVLGRRMFGENAGRLATVLFAINACAVWVSQEARGYSLLMLFVIASTYLFVCLIEQPTVALACAYGVVTSLTLYCHYFGLFIPAAQAMSLVAAPKQSRTGKPLVVAGSIITLAAIPVLWMIHIQDISHIAWVQRPSFLELYHLGTYLAAAGGKAVGALLLGLDLVLLALFLRTMKSLRRDRGHDLRCWRYVLVASCLFAPSVIAMMVSIARPIFYHRFLIVSLPAWVLATAVGADGIRSRAWRVAAIAGLCVLSLACVITSFSRVQEDWRGVTRYLIAQAGPQDRVLYYQPEGSYAVEHYPDWRPGGNVPRPQGVVVNAGNDEWERQIAGAERVWLVLYRAKSDDPVAQAVDAHLRNGYTVAQEVPFRAVTVVEYQAKK